MFRKQVEHFLYRKNDDISDFDEAVDVDEDSPPLIRGYCTPVDVDEDIIPPIGYRTTSKPVAVDSAIANTVWDTIIEEEEEEFDEASNLQYFTRLYLVREHNQIYFV